MMTRSTDNTPDIPLPIGAVPKGDDWEPDGDRRYRCVSSPDLEVGPERGARVYCNALQYDDGSIHPGYEGGRDRPGVCIDQYDAGHESWMDTNIRLTAEQAREFAGHILQTAEVLDRWAAPEWDRHVCGFDWCEVNWRNENEHWWMEYTTASLRGGDPYHLSPDQQPHKVGIGVVYDEGELPCVVVHLDGGQRDDDVDAHLKIAEAVALRDLLDQAINNARLAIGHMADSVMQVTR